MTLSSCCKWRKHPLLFRAAGFHAFCLWTTYQYYSMYEARPWYPLLTWNWPLYLEMILRNNQLFGYQEFTVKICVVCLGKLQSTCLLFDKVWRTASSIQFLGKCVEARSGPFYFERRAPRGLKSHEAWKASGFVEFEYVLITLLKKKQNLSTPSKTQPTYIHGTFNIPSKHVQYQTQAVTQAFSFPVDSPARFSRYPHH